MHHPDQLRLINTRLPVIWFLSRRRLFRQRQSLFRISIANRLRSHRSILSMTFNLAPFSDLSNSLFKNFRFFLQNRKPLRRTSAPTANDDPEKLSNKLQPNLSIITQTFACYCCVLFNLARLLHLSRRFLKNFRIFSNPTSIQPDNPLQSEI